MGTFGGEGQACSWHNMYVKMSFESLLFSPFCKESETSFVLPERKRSVILLDVTCKLVLSIFKCLYNFLHWFGATIVLPFISLYSYLSVVANESEENGLFSHCTIW